VQKAKDITEIVKNIAQILARVIAGVWTYYLFGQKEAPSLEPLADVNSSLSWQNTKNDDACRAIFKIIFQNTGNSSFDISKIHLRGWLCDKMQDTTKEVTFLDIDEVQNSGKKIFDKTYESNGARGLLPFIIHYPPNSAFNHSFDWEVKNIGNKWICFEIEFFKDGENIQPKWVASSWDRVCNIQDVTE